MSAPTNAVTTLNTVGNREDLENVIYRVVAEETPFTSNIGKAKKPTAIYHEWQTESLRTPSATNAQLEGDDVTAVVAGNQPTRVGNRLQILTESGAVSGTQEVVDVAGRKSELARQKLLKGKEIARDWEMRALGNYASVAESGATTRKAAGALAWMTSNVSRGSGGASGGFSGGTVAAATNGTQRTFTETLVKGVLATCFSNGGKPTQAYMGPTHKQQFSGFTGIADVRKEVGSGPKMATIVGAADVYVSDFGNLVLIPHPYALTRDCALIDPEYWGVGTLRPVHTVELAKSGDSDKFEIIMEKTLVANNEKSSGVVADLT